MTERTLDTARPVVLLAEDDEDVRIVFEMILSERHDILPAETAAQALRLASDNRVDVVLLDWTLPDADGEEVITRLRALENFTDVPIVIVSGLSSVTSLASQFGALSCPKPCDADQLIGAIERALERRSSPS